MNAEAVAGALAAATAAGLVGAGDVIVIMPDGSHAVIRRGPFGALPCVDALAGGALLLQCVARVTSARPPVVSLHFRQVALRRRDGSCFADLVPNPVTAHVVAAPGRQPRVFVYGL